MILIDGFWFILALFLPNHVGVYMCYVALSNLGKFPTEAVALLAVGVVLILHRGTTMTHVFGESNE